MTTALKTIKRNYRQRRIRSKISGRASRPRLAVFRSNRRIYAQLIDDGAGRTLAAADSREVKAAPEKTKTMTKTAQAFLVGKLLAAKATKKRIDQVMFDRGGYLYRGRVKALALGARDGGLKF